MSEKEIVRIKVEAVNGACPIFKVGDEMLVEFQRLQLEKCTCREICMHIFPTLYPVWLDARHKKAGPSTVKCPDNGIVTLTVERM